jgi:hypothetical protein
VPAAVCGDRGPQIFWRDTTLALDVLPLLRLHYHRFLCHSLMVHYVDLPLHVGRVAEPVSYNRFRAQSSCGNPESICLYEFVVHRGVRLRSGKKEVSDVTRNPERQRTDNACTIKTIAQTLAARRHGCLPRCARWARVLTGHCAIMLVFRVVRVGVANCHQESRRVSEVRSVKGHRPPSPYVAHPRQGACNRIATIGGSLRGRLLGYRATDNNKARRFRVWEAAFCSVYSHRGLALTRGLGSYHGSRL